MLELVTNNEKKQSKQWKEKFFIDFKPEEVGTTTIVMSGLTMAHDNFFTAALRGFSFKSMTLPVADNEALRFGKEFGNRGQCNPTYFTVGNLIKFLTFLRDEKGLSTEQIISDYIFLTGGACGPCRFGMYITEYRKALRDSGFEGFRVILASQTEGIRQVIGDGMGLKMTTKLFSKLMSTFLVADVLNLLTYRVRPYEVVEGTTDQVYEAATNVLIESIENNKSLIKACLSVKKMFAEIEVDRSQVKPKVSLLGEFWAMTTEGDGNYKMQRFLESEGAEVDIQPITAWLLYTIWELRYDTKYRMSLKGTDKGLYGLDGVNTRKKLMILFISEWAMRGAFKFFSRIMGLRKYKLPNMDEIAEIGKEFYNNNLRGGEGHMEVSKLILNVVKKKANMTISVKPFGCMPSSGVSDGVQSIVTEKYPEAIFLPIETSGDGAVNVYSRVQMQLFKAKKHAQKEVDDVQTQMNKTLEEMKANKKHPYLFKSLKQPKHKYACTAANALYEYSH